MFSKNHSNNKQKRLNTAMSIGFLLQGKHTILNKTRNSEAHLKRDLIFS